MSWERWDLITERGLVAWWLCGLLLGCPPQYAEREKWTRVRYFVRASKWHDYSEAILFFCVLGVNVTELWQWNGMIPLAGVCISPLPIKDFLSILKSHHAWQSPAEFSDDFSTWALLQTHWGRIQGQCLYALLPIPPPRLQHINKCVDLFIKNNLEGLAEFSAPSRRP